MLPSPLQLSQNRAQVQNFPELKFVSKSPETVADSGVTGAGVDVAGSIGGGTSIGSGQVLSNAQGLNITINGGALGDRGSVNYSNGYAFSLDIWTSTVLTTDGALASRTGGINNSIKDLGNRRAAIETRLVGIERRYRAQFSALDGMLSSMNQTSNYLTQQLAQLAKL